MKKGDQLRANESARILTGRYAGLAGVVLEVDRQAGTARLKIEGIHHGEPISTLYGCKLANLGRPT